MLQYLIKLNDCARYHVSTLRQKYLGTDIWRDFCERFNQVWSLNPVFYDWCMTVSESVYVVRYIVPKNTFIPV